MDDLITVPRGWLTDFLTHRLMQSGFKPEESQRMAKEQIAEGTRMARGNKPQEDARPATPAVDGPATEGGDPHAANPSLQSQGGPGEDPVPVRKSESAELEKQSVIETRDHAGAIDRAIGDTVQQPPKPADQQPEAKAKARRK